MTVTFSYLRSACQEKVIDHKLRPFYTFYIACFERDVSAYISVSNGIMSVCISNTQAMLLCHYECLWIL